MSTSNYPNKIYINALLLFVPPFLNLFRRPCLPLLFKLHALNLVN